MVRAVFLCILGTTSVLILLSSGVDGQVLRPGNCAVPTTTPNTAPAPNPLNFLVGTAGTTWYVVRRTRSLWSNLICRLYTFTLKSAGPPVTIRVDTSASTWSGKNITVHGEMTTTDANFLIWTANFQRLATIPSILAKPTPFPTGYRVIGYEALAVPTWMVLYSCVPIGSFKVENVAILSQEKQMSSAAITQATAVITNANIMATLTRVEQTVCVS